MAKSNGKKADEIIKSSNLLKAVADQDRFRILMLLKEGKKNVTTLADSIGAEIVNVSHHLGVLRGNNLVKAEKVGRFVYYSLNPDMVSQEGHALHFKLAGCKLIVH